MPVILNLVNIEYGLQYLHSLIFLSSVLRNKCFSVLKRYVMYLLSLKTWTGDVLYNPAAIFWASSSFAHLLCC